MSFLTVIVACSLCPFSKGGIVPPEGFRKWNATTVQMTTTKVKPVGETQPQSCFRRFLPDLHRIAAYAVDAGCHPSRVIVPGNALFLTKVEY